MNMVCEQCRGPIGRQQGRGGRRRFCETCRPTRIRKDRPVPRSVARQTRPAVPLSGDQVTGMEQPSALQVYQEGDTHIGRTEGLDTDMFVFVGVALIDVGGIFR